MNLDERSWETIAADSVLLKAVSNWREDPEKWLEHSIDRLNETVRVNPLREDIEWVENWLQEIGAMDHFTGSVMALVACKGQSGSRETH